MRVPYSWLREYCDPGIDARELAERLAMTGTEVERVGAVGPPAADSFVVGRVIEREAHPNADPLSVCTVDTRDGDPRTIVCGATDVAGGEGEASDYASVTVEAPELCPRFTARVFTDVTVGPSPAWLQARLSAAGQRPINNVVDITNYVMLLTSQPLHAFDLDKVPDGALTVRAAAEGEKMKTLDGVERTFDAETVLVCDSRGPSGIAGIMGGQVSEVSPETKRVLLEVANWNGTNILRTSRLLGLPSQASSRLEKQHPPQLWR